jgi:anti-sigma-K factor RskA
MHEEFESIAALDAIGAATAEEAGALRAHLTACIPCRIARDEYADALMLLVRDLPRVDPPWRVRERVMKSVNRTPANTTAWWLATAATMFLALWGWREMAVRAQRAHANSQEAEIRSLQEENQVLRQRTEKLSSEMASLAAAETRTISLSGQEVAPAATAKAFVTGRRVVVFFQNLPANPDDKSYQLWIIRADQPKPMSAGIFDVKKDGSASIAIENLPVDTPIKGLAVTLEPKGGVAQPTNTNFYLAGNT